MNRENGILLLGIIIVVFVVIIFILRKTHIEPMDKREETEADCTFVSSRGILKSCTFHSPEPKSSDSYDTRYLTDMLNGDKMFDGMSIYVCSDLLSYFVDKVLPYLKNSFVLVSGDSDMTIPNDALNESQIDILLNHELLIRWYAQNSVRQEGKLFQMPIGLDYHTVSEDPNHKWLLPGEKSLPREQEDTLNQIIKESQPFYLRQPKIYVNYTVANDRFGQREESLNKVPKQLIEQNDTFTPRTKNWKLMTQYAFVLSPFGVGMDCHRTWEALCLGCIPIVCAPDFKPLFEGLPVLNVNKWQDINETLLINTIKKFKGKNLDKTLLKYWVEKINEV
jgi:hypothetical protein